MHYLISLSLTLLAELLFALIWGIRKKDLLLVGLVNLLTNPLVVLVHGLLLPCGFLVHTLLPELWAMGTEAAIYHRKKNRIPYPVLFGILANALSYSTGFLLQLII